jgi:2-keto-4-pentenoate hydratase
MTPEELLRHFDTGTPWPQAPGLDVPAAYQRALAVRRLRIARGERPRGFKVGFTNRAIWQRYNVDSPIWGTVWDSTLAVCEGECDVRRATLCQPRLEPEAVFGVRARPPAHATPEELFACLDWVAPGFEIVQSHQPGWKFVAADTVADGGLHGRLVVGRKVPVGEVAGSAAEFERRLAAAQVVLYRGHELVERGQGANVLDGPLHALHHFVRKLRECPGAPDLEPGDVVTTGTWTDAWPVASGERWLAQFEPPLSRLAIDFA